MHLEAAIAIHRQLLDRRFEAIALADLGAVLAEQGELEAAFANQERALAIHRETGDRRDQGIVLGNIADLLVRQGRHDEAGQAFTQAEALLREVGDRMRLIWLLCGRARAEGDVGNRALAESTLGEAEALAAAIGAAPDSELGREIAATREGLALAAHA